MVSKEKLLAPETILVALPRAGTLLSHGNVSRSSPKLPLLERNEFVSHVIKVVKAAFLVFCISLLSRSVFVSSSFPVKNLLCALNGIKERGIKETLRTPPAVYLFFPSFPRAEQNPEPRFPSRCQNLSSAASVAGEGLWAAGEPGREEEPGNPSPCGQGGSQP